MSIIYFIIIEVVLLVFVIISKLILEHLEHKKVENIINKLENNLKYVEDKKEFSKIKNLYLKSEK